MKNSNHRYFVEAENAANGKFSNANGFQNDWDNFDDELMADGTEAQKASTSQPYIINVTNTTGAAINNVLVLGANNNVNAANFGNPAGITISMGLANVTYTEFLFQSMTKPFLVGLTYLQSANESQILETLSLRHKDSNGNLCDKTIVPIIDPYQQQTKVVAIKNLYTIDGLAQITLSSVLANATLKLYIYPAEKLDLRRALAGNSVEAGYSDPKIVKGQTVTIAPAAVKALAMARG